jgi:hypothetical protein
MFNIVFKSNVRTSRDAACLACASRISRKYNIKITAVERKGAPQICYFILFLRISLIHSAVNASAVSRHRPPKKQTNL